MALFRFYRVLLEDSLKTTVIIKTRKELEDKILQWFYSNHPVSREAIDSDCEIKINPYGIEEKTGWFVQVVTLRYADNGNVIVGYLSEPLDDTLDNKNE